MILSQLKNEQNVKNTELDKASYSEFQDLLNQYLTKYDISEYQEPERNSPESDTLTVFPEIRAFEYPNQNQLTLPKNSHLALYDFWYQDCPPCIKAIPYLNEIYSKYSDRNFEVIGINPIDNNEKDIQRLDKFFKYNQTNYPVYLTSQEEIKALNLRSYPTLFLVDSKNKILFKEIGFDIHTMNKLDSIINAHLN